jgi:hypothetical protein
MYIFSESITAVSREAEIKSPQRNRKTKKLSSIKNTK